MKIFLTSTLCLVLLSVSQSVSAQTKTVTSNEIEEKIGGKITQSEIDSFQTQLSVSEKSDSRLLFEAIFLQVSDISDTDRKKYTKNGKIPYRIACDLRLHKTANGKDVQELQKGNVQYIILDPDGKVAVKKSASADKMKISDDRKSGGVTGELTKPGEYTAIIWMDRGMKGLFGQTIKVTFYAIN